LTKGNTRRKGRGRRDPAWARLLVVFGALMMIGSGGAFVVKDAVFGYATRSVQREDLLPGEPDRHVSVSGPKNILLVGIDPRPNQDPTEAIRSDSILILHIPASHDMAFLISIPRDTWVSVPKYSNGKRTYIGGKDKINGAFAEGGYGLTGKDQRKHGTSLLANTIKQNWGITFDAAAIVDFVGFQEVVKVLGGVDMYVDQRTVSVHIGHDAHGNVKVPFEQRDAPNGDARHRRRPSDHPEDEQRRLPRLHGAARRRGPGRDDPGPAGVRARQHGPGLRAVAPEHRRLELNRSL
jgi:LCP family protein required for cell wall assembly